MKTTLISIVVAASVSVALAQSGAPPKKQSKGKAPAARNAPKAPATDVPVKVAVGRYELRGTGMAPGRKFEEPWELYRTKVGFELKQWFEVSQNGEPNPRLEITVGFAPGFFPTSVVLAGENNKNPISCSLTLKLFSCESPTGKSELAMEGPYSFFLPDPWMMGAVVRRARKAPDQPTSVQLVRMAGMTQSGPRLEKLEAVIHYIGEDQVEVAGKKQVAHIYELKTERFPALTLWITGEGIVTAMEDSKNPDQRMMLIEYSKTGKF